MTSKLTIVAELTTNHFGSLLQLERMINLAVDSGADLIKVQKRSVDSFYSSDKLSSPYSSPFGDTFGDYRRAIELHEDGFALLDRVCRERGVEWFASALDVDSFQYFASRGHKLIKLPSTVTHHQDLIEVASRSGIDVVVSTGMIAQGAVDELLKSFSETKRIYLLQCTSAYPTTVDDCNVGVVRAYWYLSQADDRIIPGYSSHDPGAFGSSLAVAAGAMMLEKHVKLGSTSWAHFDNVALDLESGEFRDYVATVRQAEEATGHEIKAVLTSEHHKYAQHQAVA